ncbi:MAG TPA: TPM domain-containing protein [Sporichthya sp.]|nr:TPM domain-containing protein [Sporichthya sp.]
MARKTTEAHPPGSPPRAKRGGRFLGGLTLAGIATLTPVSAGAAEAPGSVTAPLTDVADQLTATQETAVGRTLADARAAGIDLHVLLVDDTGGTPATRYAEEVALASSLGGDDALLVVAFGQHTYALWTADPLGVSGSEINSVLDRRVAPQLRAGNVPAAISAAAAGLDDAKGSSNRGVGGGGGGGLPLFPILIVGGLGAFFLLRRRRRRPDVGQGEPEPAPADLDALAAQANAALVRVDDQIRDAGHEVGYAEAQFGPEEAGALRAGLTEASAELRSAFAVRQQLDDQDPETPAEQLTLLQTISEHAAAAETAVQAQLQRLTDLRGLERDPAAALAGLQARASGVEQRVPATEATFAELRAAAPRAADAVDGNAAEAAKRVDFAQERLAEAAAAPAADAARTMSAAGAALAQAEQLLNAVDDLAARTGRARAELPRELQEAELALARAEDLLASRRHVVGREARTRLAEAQRRFDAAQTLAEQDPAAAAAEADAAERLADEAFDLAWSDSENGGGSGGMQGFGWGMPVILPLPIGGIGFGGTSWGGSSGGFGGSVGGGGFGGGSVGGGSW